jgi:hypothetical protein
VNPRDKRNLLVISTAGAIVLMSVLAANEHWTAVIILAVVWGLITWMVASDRPRSSWPFKR